MKPLFENPQKTYTTEIKIPISEFNDKDKDLREEYARRASSLAIKKAKIKIAEQLCISESQLPLDLQLESKFKMISLGKSIFKVEITGKQKFIEKIQK